MAWAGQVTERDSDHGEPNESGDSACITLEVAGEATVADDPSEGALQDPAFEEKIEMMKAAAHDDLELPALSGGDAGLHRRFLISAVATGQRDKGKQPARTAQHGEVGITTLRVGRMHDYAQEKAERIDTDVPLAVRDFLAHIKALRVERRAPF